MNIRCRKQSGRKCGQTLLISLIAAFLLATPAYADPQETAQNPSAEEIVRDSVPEDRNSYEARNDGTITVNGETFQLINDPVHGNEGCMRMTKSAGPDSEKTDWDVLQNAIAEFVEKYDVNRKHTDFEKEIAIIRGLVKECTYEVKQGSLENYTAYSCLVGHRAQCAGYSDAFLQIVRAVMPDTEVRYIHSDLHAWNLIRLGRHWYHVDATWEDDDSTGDLVNRYINLSDDEIESTGYHHWDREDTGTPAVSSADGEAYGPMTVQYYLQSGKTEATPDPLVIKLAPDGSTRMTEVRDRIVHAVRRSMDAGRHITRIYIDGLGYGIHREQITTIMLGVRDRLRQSLQYLPQSWFVYQEDDESYTVAETGTMISILTR